MSAIEYVLWLFYPKHCVSCGKVIGRNEHLCKACSPLIERTDKLCIKCGQDKKKCVCKYNVYHFDSCVGPLVKNDYSMSAVYNFKMGDNHDVANFFADEMYPKIKQYYGKIKFDGICAVPMRKLKRFTKGYNHSEVIARRLSKKIGVKYFEALGKNKIDLPQHRMKRDERFENAKGAYYITKRINYKNVLLVDDIKSSGATLDECTRQLKLAGAENVYCAVAVVNQGDTCKEKRNNI